MYETTEDHAAMLGKMFALAPRLARELGVVNGSGSSSTPVRTGIRRSSTCTCT